MQVERGVAGSGIRGGGLPGSTAQAPMHQAFQEVRPLERVLSKTPFFSAPVPVDGSSVGSPASVNFSHSSADICQPPQP